MSNESENDFKMSELTVEILKDLAKQGKVPSVVIEDNEFDSSIAKTNWFLRHDENKIVNFHYNSTILMWAEHALGLSLISKLQNMFEEAYQGFHLDIESFTKTQCILVIKKNDVESLKISDDYKLATEKMAEVREVRGIIEETKNIQKESAVRINDLFKKLEDVREYAKQLQLREENEKKVSEQLNNINSDIKELEIRLKKDIPELDKSLDINNFR